MAPTCVLAVLPSQPNDLFKCESCSAASTSSTTGPFDSAFRNGYCRTAKTTTRGAAVMPTNPMVKCSMQQTIALAVIARLHQWCRQLIWLTLICVIGCCGESSKQQQRNGNVEREIRRRLLTQHVGRNAVNFRRSKSIAEIEQQLLRHLTGTVVASTSSTVAARSSTASQRLRRRPASAPPSPELYDIREESDLLDAAELASA